MAEKLSANYSLKEVEADKPGSWVIRGVLKVQKYKGAKGLRTERATLVKMCSRCAKLHNNQCTGMQSIGCALSPSGTNLACSAVIKLDVYPTEQLNCMRGQDGMSISVFEDVNSPRL